MDKILNHREHSVRATYNRYSFAAEIQKAMEVTSASLSGEAPDPYEPAAQAPPQKQQGRAEPVAAARPKDDGRIAPLHGQRRERHEGPYKRERKPDAYDFAQEIAERYGHGTRH
jgi:hypothetical protein